MSASEVNTGRQPVDGAKHIRYFMSCLKGLTYHYAGNDQNRLMVVRRRPPMLVMLHLLGLSSTDLTHITISHCRYTSVSTRWK